MGKSFKKKKVKVRRSWPGTFKPVTKIKESEKLYNRKRAKRDVRLSLHND